MTLEQIYFIKQRAEVHTVEREIIGVCGGRSVICDDCNAEQGNLPWAGAPPKASVFIPRCLFHCFEKQQDKESCKSQFDNSEGSICQLCVMEAEKMIL